MHAFGARERRNECFEVAENGSHDGRDVQMDVQL